MAGKRVYSPDEAVADVFDEAVVMVGGFATPGAPQELVKALIRRRVRRLTTISNSAHGRVSTLHDVTKLVEAGLVARCITSFPIYPGVTDINAVATQFREGRLEVEIVLQGTLAEQIRAGGSGIPAFWVQTGVNTPFEAGKEKRMFDGQECVLEYALRADFALIKAKRADTLGNLVYDKSQRNYGPIMAMAADVTVVEVDEVVEPGHIDPEAVITPGIFVDRLVVPQGRGVFQTRPYTRDRGTWG